MTQAVAAPPRWLSSAGVVTLVHAAAVIGAIWLGIGEREIPIEEPIVLIDLPPLAAAAAVSPSAQQLQPSAAEPQRREAKPPVAVPNVAAPLPREFVAVPPPAPVPAPATLPRVAAPAPVDPAPARQTSASAPAALSPAATGSSPNDGDNPRARQQEADYFAQLSAHLNKRKRYPTEAKKARQQGVVTVRFTVHADGSVSGSTIRRSSGHDLLDTATLELLQRVSPLPRFPRSMTKPSVTLSLPIDYSLQTS